MILVTLQYALEQMGSHLEACFWKCYPKFPFARIPIFMARCLFSTLRLRVLFSQEIVPHFVYLLNPFLSVFPCKKAKSCFSKSFCRLARRWPRFPFARIPIFNALCLFFVLVPYSHLLEFPFARKCTVRRASLACPHQPFSKPKYWKEKQSTVKFGRKKTN